MSLNAKSIKTTGGKGSSQKAIEAGTYPARVVQVIDLGLQAQKPYQGKEKPPAHKLMVTYELVDEFCKDEGGNEQKDKPRWLSEEFNLFSLSQENAKSSIRYVAIDSTLSILPTVNLDHSAPLTDSPPLILNIFFGLL